MALQDTTWYGLDLTWELTRELGSYGRLLSRLTQCAPGDSPEEYEDLIALQNELHEQHRFPHSWDRLKHPICVHQILQASDINMPLGMANATWLFATGMVTPGTNRFYPEERELYEAIVHDSEPQLPPVATQLEEDYIWKTTFARQVFLDPHELPEL